MGGDRHLGICHHHGGRGNSIAMLSVHVIRLRLSPPRRQVSQAVPGDFGAGSVMGGGAVSDGAEDRLRGSVRGDRGAALCTVFRADAGADGLLLAISMEPCSPKLRICVLKRRRPDMLKRTHNMPKAG